MFAIKHVAEWTKQSRFSSWVSKHDAYPRHFRMGGRRREHVDFCFTMNEQKRRTFKTRAGAERTLAAVQQQHPDWQLEVVAL